MKKLALERIGVVEMTTEEKGQLNGGIDLPKFLKGGIATYVATQVISHWAEIKSGFIAGYNAKI